MIQFDIETRQFAVQAKDYDRLDDLEVATELAKDKDILARPEHYRRQYIRSGKITGGITGGALGAGAGVAGSRLVKNPLAKGALIVSGTGSGVYAGIKLGKKAGLSNYKSRVELANLDRTLREKSIRDAAARRRIEEAERRERLQEEKEREELERLREINKRMKYTRK